MVRLTIDLPFTINLPDGEYICRLGRDEFTIMVELVAQPPESPGRAVSITLAPATGEVKEAPRTRASVQYGLRVQTPDVEGLGEEDHERARRFLNAFIDSYRSFFNDTLVYALSPAEFYAVRYGLAPRYLIETRDDTGQGKGAMGVTFGDQPICISAVLRPEQDLQRFRESVGRNAQPPLVNILLLNAKAYLSRGQYRLAVIEAGSVLDISAEECAKRLLVREGKATDRALKELERLSTKAIIESIVEPRVPVEFIRSDDWQKYDSQLRPLRNSVVHDAVEPPKQQAEDFLNTTESLIQRLRAFDG